MTTTIAIDFGTSRTKLAYLKNGKPELMRFGHDRPYVPSLFYLPAGDGPIRWGNDAEAMLARDPAGVVVTLKRQLGERSVRGAGGRKETPGRLLALMLSDLRRWAGERLPAFGGQPPSRVCLTLPSLYRPVEERALRDAAAEAGFAADAVELLPEPVAAARAWLAETGNAADEVVVFDAGGGTIDWAYLRRDNGAFRVVPECPADGDRQVGGQDVDELLLELLEEAAGDEIAPRRSHFLQEVRHLKEAFCRDLPLSPVWIGGREVTLPAKAIAAAIEERFISQACDALGRYLDKVRTMAGSKGLPPVLLVGGSSALKGLAPALEQRLGCKTAQWERSEYATVLGGVTQAVAPPDLPEAHYAASPSSSNVAGAAHPDRMEDFFRRIIEDVSGTPDCHILKLGPMYLVVQAGAKGIDRSIVEYVTREYEFREQKILNKFTEKDCLIFYRQKNSRSIELHGHIESRGSDFCFEAPPGTGIGPAKWAFDRMFRPEVKPQFYAVKALMDGAIKQLRSLSKQARQ